MQSAVTQNRTFEQHEEFDGVSRCEPVARVDIATDRHTSLKDNGVSQRFLSSAPAMLRTRRGDRAHGGY
jgi:hypothetical protein